MSLSFTLLHLALSPVHTWLQAQKTMAALENGVKAAFGASIFKRGQKAELFDGGDGVDELAELQSKLGELHAVWALERTG